ncbi:MAG: PEP-CTERM sorting domain-containing protein [Leptothrix sp. (in: Bacteria)]|jgi:hypothetical protein|nr:PEP-CTERM sorting domain-containing protein [Leptothrix sp. (in: b-proteobacteria)]
MQMNLHTPRRLHALPLLAALLCGGLSATAQAASYDAAADFSSANGGSSVWSYGWDQSDAAGDYNFTALDLYASSNDPNTGYKTWNASTHSYFGTPGLWVNLGSSTLYGVAVGQLTLHPAEHQEGFANDNAAILRFTAPTAASYTVHAQFLTGDGGQTEAWIVRNDSFSSATALGITSADPVYAATLSLAAGETVDFVVGHSTDNLWGDNTPVIVTIQSAVPEPESWALIAGGLALLAGLRRRGARH